MPSLAQGANTTLTLDSNDIVTIVAHGGEYKVEQPSGTLIYAGGDTRAFGPFAAGGSFKITANQLAVVYEQASLFQGAASVIVAPEAPVDADGRPNGTVWIQTT